jgi:hypothetical protein
MREFYCQNSPRYKKFLMFIRGTVVTKVAATL